jgi:hypothetical protein
MICTWKDCNDKASNPQLDKNGNEWANLCEYHHKKLEDSIVGENFNPKIALKNWILASGGAKEMTKKIIGE